MTSDLAPKQPSGSPAAPLDLDSGPSSLGQHPPLSVASSSGSRSLRAAGPGRGTWPSAWPPPLSRGWRSSPGHPVDTNRRLRTGPSRLLDELPMLRTQAGCCSLRCGGSGAALLCLDQISVFPANIRTAQTGLSAPRSCRNPGQDTETRQHPQASQQQMSWQTQRRLKPGSSPPHPPSPLPHLQPGSSGRTLFPYAMINSNLTQVRKRVQSPPKR